MAASVLNRELNYKFFAFPQSEIGAKKPPRQRESSRMERMNHFYPQQCFRNAISNINISFIIDYDNSVVHITLIGGMMLDVLRQQAEQLFSCNEDLYSIRLHLQHWNMNTVFGSGESTTWIFLSWHSLRSAPSMTEKVTKVSGKWSLQYHLLELCIWFLWPMKKISWCKLLHRRSRVLLDSLLLPNHCKEIIFYISVVVSFVGILGKPREFFVRPPSCCWSAQVTTETKLRFSRAVKIEQQRNGVSVPCDGSDVKICPSLISPLLSIRRIIPCMKVCCHVLKDLD